MKKIMSFKSSFKVLIHMGQLSHHIVTQGSRMVMHLIPNESFGQPVFLSFKILDISTLYAFLLTINLYMVHLVYSWFYFALLGNQNRTAFVKADARTNIAVLRTTLKTIYQLLTDHDRLNIGVSIFLLFILKCVNSIKNTLYIVPSQSQRTLNF